MMPFFVTRTTYLSGSNSLTRIRELICSPGSSARRFTMFTPMEPRLPSGIS